MLMMSLWVLDIALPVTCISLVITYKMQAKFEWIALHVLNELNEPLDTFSRHSIRNEMYTVFMGWWSPCSWRATDFSQLCMETDPLFESQRVFPGIV